MKREYKLIEILENFDSVINEKIILFNLSPIQYNGNESYFNPESDEIEAFSYIHTDEIENYFMSNRNEIIFLDLSKFECLLMTDENGNLKKTYLENEYYKKREDSISWQKKTKKNLTENNQIGFKFSHYQCAFFEFGRNYDPLNNREDIVPSSFEENNIIIKNESYIVLSNSTIYFIEEGINNNITRISGKVRNIIYENNEIKKIETNSAWAASNNVKIDFEFNCRPLKFLDRTEKNIIITIYGNGTQSPPIRAQFSLMFGKDIGIVTLE